MAGKASRSAQAAAVRQQIALDGWLETHTSPNTRAAYRSDLGVFAAWCARRGALPLTVDAATLVTFQAAREAAGDSPSTIRRRWSALSSFYDFAVDQQLRSGNPANGADRPKFVSGNRTSTTQLSDDAVASYRAVAAALDPRLDALIGLLVSEGLKVAEALALDIADLSGKPTAITIRRRGEARRIVLDPQSARAVRRCVGKRTTGPVFVNERSSKSDAPDRLTRFGADHLIRRLRTDDTTQPVTANTLRRYHINASQRDGPSLEASAERAGLATQRSDTLNLDRPRSRSRTPTNRPSPTVTKSRRLVDVPPRRDRRQREERST